MTSTTVTSETEPRASEPGVPAAGDRPSLAVRRARRRTIREDAVNLPNLLTMLRVVLIPLALWLIADGTPRACFWAGAVYAVSAFTDFLDGWLARRMGLISVLGKFLDPLADKLLVISSLLVMIAMDWVPAWAVIIIVARELSVTSLRVIAMSEGVEMAASQGGKEKAALQMIAVLLLMVHYPYEIDFGIASVRADFNAVGLATLYISVFFALWSGGEYVKLFVDAVEMKEKRLAEQDREEDERAAKNAK
jgi:CDP-diacylglycerol--glycerol-3-phosphate 3-phosphatidyltransferase